MATFDRARTLAIVNLGLFTVLFLITLAYLNYTSKFKNMLQYSFINNDIYKSNSFYCFGKQGSPIILKNSAVDVNDFLNLTKGRLYAATDQVENPHNAFRSSLSGKNGIRRVWRDRASWPLYTIKVRRPYAVTPETLEASRNIMTYVKYHFFANNFTFIDTQKGIKTLDYASKYLV